MHPLAELLNLENTACHLPATSRKRALQGAAELISGQNHDGLTEDELFDGLMARERLGSTGLGEGVAIPHCRLQCSKIKVALVSLPTPIDYEASDGQGVDLLFVLVVPVDESQAHLDALASLSEVFASQANRQQLRSCSDRESLLASMQTLLNQQVTHSKSA